MDDKHITQDVTFKSEDLVKFERKIGDADKEMDKLIAQCQDIREKMPDNKVTEDKKAEEVAKMKN